MSDPLLAAVIAASAALVVAFLNSIVAEIYRRHRDKKAMAAAIAGELASYQPAFPLIQTILNTAIQSVESGKRMEVSFRAFEKPKDFVFEKAVERLGLLGPKLAEDIVFVYGNLNGFRVAFALICSHFQDMSDAELLARCVSCLAAAERAAQRAEPLVVELKHVAGT